MNAELRAGLTALLPRLRRFGLALTGARADAEDLVQTACERALLRSGQLRDHQRMDAWVYGIMRNLWVDEMRARRVRRHDDIDAMGELAGSDGVAVVEGRITLQAVRRALGEMAEERRSVMVLVCVDGLSYREAARVLDVPIGTVMSRLSRARLELQARLAPADQRVAQFAPRRD